MNTHARRSTIPTEPHDPIVDVVVRCKDEMPFTARTLAMLLRQRGVHARILFLDCGSKDGSREAASEMGVRILDLDPAAYVPGVVLNLGMRETSSRYVAFINADAVPGDELAVARLIQPLAASATLAATYGRQLPRPDAAPEVRVEYERAFPAEGRPALRRGTFFSMAASAIRRATWEMLPFDEGLRYSEDVDWTHRAASLGARSLYVPAAAFEHSHDYDLEGQRRRRAGEGEADAAIFHLGAPSLLSDLARPLAGALLRDLRTGVASPQVARLRAAQALGYYQGRRRASA